MQTSTDERAFLGQLALPRRSTIFPSHADRSTAIRPSGRPRQDRIDEAVLNAARTRLLADGYARLTLADIAADAGVTRPSIYRRWSNKLELVVDVLDRGFDQQRPDTDDNTDVFDRPSPKDVFAEAIRRVNPAFHNRDAMLLIGDVIGESRRTPELLDILRRRGVEPRLQTLRIVISRFQEQGVIRDDIDVPTVLAVCGGSYMSAFLNGELDADLPNRVATLLWPMLSTERGPDNP